MSSDRKIKIEMGSFTEWLLFLIVINLAFISFALGGIKDTLGGIREALNRPAQVEQETKK